MCSPTLHRVSASTPAGSGGIVEDAKQDQRIAGVAIGEEAALEAEGERDAFHQAVAEPGHRGEVVEDGRP